MRTAAFPGSFDPPTQAHLAIAAAAVAHAELDRVDLVLSVDPLGKDPRGRPPVAHRRLVLERVARSRPWLGVVVSEHALIAEIARGYDVVVMGVDKWDQIRDPRWYGGSERARDDAIASLPRVLVVPRAGIPVTDAESLPIDLVHAHTSSTRARAGARHLVLPEALPETSPVAREDPPCDG